MKEYCATEKNGDIWYVQTDGVLKYCPEKDEWIVDVPEGKSVWQDWNLAEQIESPILRARILITRETMKTPELRELVTTKQALESIYEGFKYFVVKIDTLYEALDNSDDMLYKISKSGIYPVQRRHENLPIEVNPIEKPIVNNVQNLIKPRRTHR